MLPVFAPGSVFVDREIVLDFEAENWGIRMSGTGEDVIEGGEHRPSEDGSPGMSSGYRLVQLLARSMRSLTTLGLVQG